MDPRGQRQSLGNELRCGDLRLSRVMGKVKGRREPVHHGVSRLTSINANTTLSREKDEYVGSVPNKVVSREKEISPATGSTTKKKKIAR